MPSQPGAVTSAPAQLSYWLQLATRHLLTHLTTCSPLLSVGRRRRVAPAGRHHAARGGWQGGSARDVPLDINASTDMNASTGTQTGHHTRHALHCGGCPGNGRPLLHISLPLLLDAASAREARASSSMWMDSWRQRRAGGCTQVRSKLLMCCGRLHGLAWFNLRPASHPDNSQLLLSM